MLIRRAPVQTPAVSAPQLDLLRDRVIAPRQIKSPRLVAGLALRVDPATDMTAEWRSPRARLLELRTKVRKAGTWAGLHLSVDLPDLGAVAYLGFVARVAASEVLTLRPCLRSGLPGGGFHDCLFDRHILCRPGEGDHQDMIVPDRQMGLPMQAPWRELVIFLPPDRGVHWALHDLRLFALWR